MDARQALRNHPYYRSRRSIGAADVPGQANQGPAVVISWLDENGAPTPLENIANLPTVVTVAPTSDKWYGGLQIDNYSDTPVRITSKELDFKGDIVNSQVDEVGTGKVLIYNSNPSAVSFDFELTPVEATAEQQAAQPQQKDQPQKPEQKPAAGGTSTNMVWAVGIVGVLIILYFILSSKKQASAAPVMTAAPSSVGGRRGRSKSKSKRRRR